MHIYIYIYTYIDAQMYRCSHISADPSACGLLNAIRFDSKSEVKRNEAK